MKDKEKVKLSLYITFGYAISLFGVVLIACLIIFLCHLAGYNFDSRQGMVTFLSVSISSIVIGLIIASVVCKRALKPIDEIKKSLDSVARGDYSKKIDSKKNLKYLKSIILQYNRMLEELNTNTMLKEDFIHNFSHEFKTPIVSILGYAELIRDEPGLSNEERDAYLKIIISESKRLSNLSQQTMLLAKLESKTIPPVSEEYRVDLQLEECVLVLDQEMKKKGIEIQLQLFPLTYSLNRPLFIEVWLNLLSNAVKYCSQNGKIDISMFESDIEYKISIRDNGIGMSQEAVAHAFDKYYQGDTSRKTEGIGLGLSIANNIVSLYQGRIEIQSVEEHGSVFTVILPKI